MCNFYLDDIKMYRERVEQLEAEVSKLSDQLVQAAAKRAVVFEEVIVAEGRYDRLKEKLEEFCQETEKSIETLTSTHFDPEEKRNQLSQFRRVFSDLRQILTTETVEEQTTASDEETEEQMETDGVEEEKKHLERQRQQEAEMERLIKMIREKEKVANVAKLNDVQIEQLKQQHEKELRDLEAKILSLEQQKEHAQSSTAKVGELRRKRLMEVEAELKEARKQLKEAQKAQKLKAQNAREIQKLHEEIKVK